MAKKKKNYHVLGKIVGSVFIIILGHFAFIERSILNEASKIVHEVVEQPHLLEQIVNGVVIVLFILLAFVTIRNIFK